MPKKYKGIHEKAFKKLQKKLIGFISDMEEDIEQSSEMKQIRRAETFEDIFTFMQAIGFDVQDAVSFLFDAYTLNVPFELPVRGWDY